MNKPKTRNENIVIQEMGHELLIYDLKTNKAFCLNETSALIYQLCDGKRSAAEISDLMSVKLKTLVSEEFVWLTLNELKREDLLELDAESERFLNSVSRRELIKKAGLTSMIALPLITGLVAPKAAEAASGICSGIGQSVCAGAQDGCCNASRKCCFGSFCCHDDEVCCNGFCCAIEKKCCGSICCNLDAQCCGNTCC